MEKQKQKNKLLVLVEWLDGVEISFNRGQQELQVLDSITLLMSAGIDTAGALSSVVEEASSKRLRKQLQNALTDVESGLQLWESLQINRVLNDEAIALIKVGEESGQLVEKLEILAEQQLKAQQFRSKVRSAMLYPAFIFTTMVIVALGVSWFSLPRLASVFSQLNVELPALTQALIDFGILIDKQGIIVIPSILLLLTLIVYIVFINRRTKVIGQWLLFAIPISKRVITEIEIAKFGFTLGNLLKAGITIDQSLEIMHSSASFFIYRDFYSSAKQIILEGGTFKDVFRVLTSSKKIFPISLQQMVISGEQSGRLEEVLMALGKRYEQKADVTSQNLSVILEPILLVIVWVGVLVLAVSVILPIYSLVGNLGDLI